MFIKKDTGKVFVCTDIHGNLPLLLKALDSVGFDRDQDLLISCGDLIDRGTHSRETLEFFLYNDFAVSVMGNHDEFLADSKGIFKIGCNWGYNGGGWALKDPDLKSLATEASKLPYYITLKYKGDTYGFVHAEVPRPFKSWEDFTIRMGTPKSITRESALWNRSVNFFNPVEGVKFVFHGHNIIKEPRIITNRVYFDTGATYKNKLTLIEIADTLIFTEHSL